MRLFLFPGQSSQIVGMGRDLYQSFDVAKEIFEEVDEVLNRKLSKIIFDGPEADLNLTVNTQPALMVLSVAISRIIEKLSGMKLENLGNFVAGHSLGEYSALCSIGSIKLSDCAKILHIRGQAMQNAVPVGKGAMLAIIGANIEEVEDICKKSVSFGVCEIANNNCPGQIVISGEAVAIEKAAEFTREIGKRAIKLPLSAAFHCSLMRPVEKILDQELRNLEIKQSNLGFYSNVTGKLVKDYIDLKELLVKQVSNQVKWQNIIENAYNEGVREFIEIGTGKVLIPMMKKFELQDISTKAISNPESIEEFIKEFI